MSEMAMTMRTATEPVARIAGPERFDSQPRFGRSLRAMARRAFGLPAPPRI